MEMKQMDSAQKEVLLALVDRTGSIVVCSQGKDGYPNAKAMLNLEHEDLKTFFFSTNLSARRTKVFKSNPKACIYIFDPKTFQGMMLSGDMNVCTDRATRERLWREGFEMYYPAGIDDPDYCVLRFEARAGNYYHGLNNFDFEIAGACGQDQSTAATAAAYAGIAGSIVRISI